MTDADRDYDQEFRQLIDSVIPTSEFVARLLAEDVVEKLRANDPGLLAGWLDLHAGDIIGDYVRSRCNSIRARSRTAIPRRAFAEAVERFTANNDPVVFDPFAAVYVVNNDNLRRRVADMTSADHLFVADRYADDKNTAAMLEAFHRAVAKKIGTLRTADVFSPDQYLEMYQSITRTGAA